MATSKKIIIDKNKIDIVTTNYNQDFLNNINKQGRKKHNYLLLSDKQLKRCITTKIKALKKHNNKLNYIRDNNSFNIFITIRGINTLGLKKFIDRTRKADKNLMYVTLASWSINMDLHYHIILNTSLDQEQLEDKLKNIDGKIEIIYNQKKLLKYFKKNLNFDTIHILKQVDNKELRDKQIEILSYAKILTHSRNINAKPKIIKNPSQEQLQEVYNNTTYIKTIEYKNIDSMVQIDKFQK